MEERDQATRLLAAIERGETGAAEELFAVVYADLRRVAAAYLGRERKGHTLQPTALVHEAYCRLVDAENLGYSDRHHFYAVAARAMRRILVDHARKRKAAKRGGGASRVPLDRLPELPDERDAWLAALDDVLADLERLDARQAQVVELRFFGGLTIQETAATLGVSHATVERDWKVARAWLARELGRFGPETD